MKLIITASIKKTEFEPLQKKFSLDVIKITAKKSLEGLGKSIKSSVKVPGTCLKKLYLTGPEGAGRVVFLLKISAKKSILVISRSKNDKKIGINMTIKNLKFKKLLEKNLDLLLKDIEKDDYEEYEL